MSRIGDAERRARLAIRHHLACEARVDEVAEAARGVVALHSTDPASVYLSAAARLRAPEVAAIERALYEDVGADATRAVQAAAEALAAWIGPVRVTPRFRTPLERELSGGSR